MKEGVAIDVEITKSIRMVCKLGTFLGTMMRVGVAATSAMWPLYPMKITIILVLPSYGFLCPLSLVILHDIHCQGSVAMVDMALWNCVSDLVRPH